MENALTQHVLGSTRFGSTQGSSLLDLVLTHDNDDVDGLVIHPPLANSDHGVLDFNLRAGNLVSFQPKSRPSVWHADIVAIKERASTADWSVNIVSSIEDEWDRFKNTLERVTTDLIPWRVPKRPTNRPPWINRQAITLLRRRKRFWNLFVSTGLQQFRLKYCETRNQCKTLIHQSRIAYETQLVKSSPGCPKRLFSYIKRRTRKSDAIPPLMLEDDQTNMAEDNLTKAEALSKHFSQVFSDNIDTSFVNFPEGNLKMAPLYIGKDTVLKWLLRLNPGKSSGPDELHPRILTALAESIAEPLSVIFNMSLDQSKCPRDWKDAIISPVFKTGSRNLVQNYRPVSLTSIVVKLLERIIRDAIIQFIEGNKLFAVEQHGFRAGHSCLTNLLLARESWASSADANIPVDAIFIDLSKAFDRVSHSGLLVKLGSLGINKVVTDWIQDFLKDRRQRVRVNGVLSTWESVKSGVPQGTILGPLLFLIYVNEIPSVVKSSCLLFADDIKIWRALHDDSDQLALQEDLNLLSDWCKHWALEINLSKSVVMHVSHSHVHNYSMNGITLPVVTEYKDLGVVVQHDLKTATNCRTAATKGFRMLWAIRKAFANFDADIFRILYPTYIRPHLEYGIQAASPCFKYEIDLLERVQRVGTKLIKGFSTLSYEERLSRLGLFPLSYRRLRGDLILAYRILRNDFGANLSKLFLPSSTNQLRGHHLKVQKPRSNRLRLEIRFSHRIVNHWNSLPEHVVSAPSVDSFKARLDLLYAINRKD
uniref:Reverse transcriptase domain-containing protein n=2 Tax=Trichobilharzia regenti TaxID=157069 RepID=A0AA85JQW3_TRIRE|nr:unnamed protein product [Trichobilharzia regenti]CAH8832846.1 unnamed protein product [Trichobilharzia regenti]CAH8851638.1 unnamed protein product [Trichobilharzia regenti]CAH8868946.1 unnamed protein product [Trichobilharzia regenti]CAH8876533.1 unnamed protein product [Trichobilharzia regenti]